MTRLSQTARSVGELAKLFVVGAMVDVYIWEEVGQSSYAVTLTKNAANAQ